MALCLACAPLVTPAAAAEKPAAKSEAKAQTAGPRSLGGTKGWTAYSAGDKKSLVCYLVGHPTKSLPANVARGPVSLSITDRPGDKSFDVVEFVLGYPAKHGSSAELRIDDKKYSPLFTDNNSAWNTNATEDRAVTTALAHGHQATIKAVSDRGTTTTDFYTLDGLNDALVLINKACGVRP